VEKESCRQQQQQYRNVAGQHSCTPLCGLRSMGPVTTGDRVSCRSCHSDACPAYISTMLYVHHTAVLCCGVQHCDTPSIWHSWRALTYRLKERLCTPFVCYAAGFLTAALLAVCSPSPFLGFTARYFRAHSLKPLFSPPGAGRKGKYCTQH
jgi:hypothetical protein